MNQKQASQSGKQSVNQAINQSNSADRETDTHAKTEREKKKKERKRDATHKRGVRSTERLTYFKRSIGVCGFRSAAQRSKELHNVSRMVAFTGPLAVEASSGCSTSSSAFAKASPAA